MGRHHKAVSEMLGLFRQAAEAERQWAAYAANLPDDDKRRLFREWWAEAEAAQAAGRYVRSCPKYLRGVTCGVRKKDGSQCRSTTLRANGRCKFHGGASTGPRSEAGRARAVENLKLSRLQRGNS